MHKNDEERIYSIAFGDCLFTFREFLRLKINLFLIIQVVEEWNSDNDIELCKKIVQ